jgi:hypothetical protein
MRSIAMTADYVLDIFQVDCDRPRQIDWIMHMMDEHARPTESTIQVLNESEPAELPDHIPWTWLRGARSFSPEDRFVLGWQGSEAAVRLHMLDPGADRVVLCGYPSTDELDCATIPMIIVRMKGKSAIFAAVWLTGRTPERIEVRPLLPRDDNLIYEVIADGRARRHLIPRLGSGN